MSNMIDWTRDDDGIVTLTMNDPEASVNTMNDAYQASMAETIDTLEAQREEVTGVILTSAKKTFFAGGDLEAIYRTTPEDAEKLFDQAQAIKAQLRRLEQLGVPVVAALNGTALGGGLEIALACHRRIAVNSPGIKFGLPEVGLGLLPGGGGIIRMVRMLGIQKALMDWLLQGQQRDPEAAHQQGVVDELVDSPEALLPAARAWIHSQQQEEPNTQPWEAKGYRIPGGTAASPSMAAILPSLPALLRQQLKGADLPAPRAILATAVEGTLVDFDTACRIESRAFASLVVGRTAKAMIQAFFFDLQSISSGRLRPQGQKPQKVGTVAILGAGMMGAGIAYSCARAGIDVVLKDVDQAGAEKGKSHVSDVLAHQVSKGRLDQESADSILARVQPTGQAADLATADVVIEAVFENLELKSAVFAEAETELPAEALLCSNTSTLPISTLQATSGRPQDFVGLHFFSPVEKMKLVEIIRGDQTSDATVARAYDLVQQIRKIPITVGDGRGFYTSRVFGTLIMEATALLEEGVDPQVIERAATQAGFPAPPLVLLDEVSLTLAQHTRAEEEKEYAASGTVREPAAGERLVDTMVDEYGRKGRAAGGGFYDYPADGGKSLWPGLREHFGRGTELPSKDIQDRYLFRMALETAHCFEDGVLTDTASANIGSIFGIGFPPGAGGTATFITNHEGGLAGFVARADELADAYGERFRPRDWLRSRGGAGTLV